MLLKNITPHLCRQKSLMAKTWYPTNFSGFYVNGKSYYKLTGIARPIGLHYKDVSLRWENKKKLSKNWPHLLSGWLLTKLWTKTWYLFMDCVTIRLQMEIGMLVLSLTLKNSRKLRKLAKFILVVREPRQSLGKMTKKGRHKFRNFPEKM